MLELIVARVGTSFVVSLWPQRVVFGTEFYRLTLKAD